MNPSMTMGGQAVIEGVMMRGPRTMIIAVRTPDGGIVVKDGEWIPFFTRYPILRLPVLRGAVVMIESMLNGVEALSFSANAALGSADPPAGAAAAPTSTRDKALTSGAIGLSLALSFGLGALLFIYLPHMVATVVMNLAGGQPALADAPVSSPAFHAIAGVVKMSVFIGYIVLISQWKDIRRVFQYHGAEHKSIYTWEAGEDLTVENARRHSTLHPRCGTSFLFFVILISIGVFTALFPLLPFPEDVHGWQRALLQASVKLPLMFPIAGLSYEFIRWAGRRKQSAILRALSWPGLLMQRLTTREPDDAQLEVALVSLQRALEREGALTGPHYRNCTFVTEQPVAA